MTVQVPFIQLKMTRGDTPVWNLAVTDGSGNPYDLSNCTIYMTAKTNIDDADVDAVFQLSTVAGTITITNAAGGLAEIVPLTTSTSSLTTDAQLYYDVQVTAPGAKKFTVVKGTLIVERDVTRA